MTRSVYVTIERTELNILIEAARRYSERDDTIPGNSDEERVTYLERLLDLIETWSA